MRAIVILTALVAVAGCKKNQAYCSIRGPACGPGFACDTTAHECQPITPGGDAGGGGDMASACAPACSGSTPICVAPDCQACTAQVDPEGACFAATPATPHCLTMGGDAGSCVGCRDNTDCQDANAPFCDTTSHACRGCIADTECPSLICDLTPGSSTRNHCVPMTQVEYVDAGAPPGGKGLTPATAWQKLVDGVNHAITDKRLYVHVAAGSYAENISNTTAGSTVFIVGADGAIVNPGNGDALGASKGGTLIVRNLVATAPGNGANCSGGSFTAYHTQFVDNQQIGVYAKGCNVLLDGIWVTGSKMGGVNIDGDFTLINSIIAKNSGGGFNQLATGTNKMIFANNTVAENMSGDVTAGVKCAAPGGFAVINSILYNNQGAGSVIGETNCPSTTNIASDDPVYGAQATVNLTSTPPGFKGTVPISPESYHLLPTSPCIDKGTASGVPDHDYDLEPRPDARTTKVDIGADEAQ